MSCDSQVQSYFVGNYFMSQLSVGKICIHQLQIKCKKEKIGIANVVITVCNSEDGTDIDI